MALRTLKNIVALYDEETRDACVLIVGFHLSAFICKRADIERRLNRTNGTSLLFREALQCVDEAIKLEKRILAETIWLNNVAKINQEVRSNWNQESWRNMEGLVETPNPEWHARDAAYPAIVGYDGKIYGNSSLAISGCVIDVPNRPYRGCEIHMEIRAAISLFAMCDFQIHRRGFAKYIRVCAMHNWRYENPSAKWHQINQPSFHPFPTATRSETHPPAP